MKSMGKIYLALIGVMPVCSHAVILADLNSPSEVMSAFNVTALGDFTTNSEVEGRLIAVGDVNGNQISNIGFELSGVATTESTFVVGGAINIQNNIQIQSGSALLKNSTSTNFNMNSGGSVVVDGTLDLSGLQSNFQSFSNSLAALADDASNYSINGGTMTINVVAGADGVGVISIDASDLALAQNGINYTGLSSAEALLINVTGTVSTIRGRANNNNEASGKVLFNIAQSNAPASISINASPFNGSILAPFSDIDNNGGFIEGSIVGLDVDMGSQEAHVPINPTDAIADIEGLIAVPEASHFGLLLSAMALGAVFRRRR